jgi:hypothetical protein
MGRRRPWPSWNVSARSEARLVFSPDFADAFSFTPRTIMTIELSPTQIKALKLVKDGGLHLGEGNKWTHLNAEVTYARTDRFKERPQPIKTVTTAVITQLRDHGLIKSTGEGADADTAAHEITMAGKMWLLQNK